MTDWQIDYMPSFIIIAFLRINDYVAMGFKTFNHSVSLKTPRQFVFYALIFRFARNKIDVLLLCLKIFCLSKTKMNLGKKTCLVLLAKLLLDTVVSNKEFKNISMS